VPVSGQVSMATYSVPVTDALLPYASFAVDNISFSEQTGSIHLSYHLPALLLGQDQHVGFDGTWSPSANDFELSGDGTGSCTVSGRTWTCHEHFTSVKVDADKLNKQLAGLPAAEAQARAAVSASFSQDPIGILSFTY
jgi:hypothetical protein